VDANAGYSRYEANRFLDGVDDLDVRLFEQPIAGWDIDGMAMLTAARPRTLIAADESIWDEHDAYRIVQAKAADVIHAKIPKCSGFFGLQKIATICEVAGLPLTVASLSMLDYGQAAIFQFIATNAICHQLRGKLRGSGLFFPEDVVQERLGFESGAFLLPDGPGVGLEIDEARVRSMSIATRSFGGVAA
jgi:muconate cycloisomerase